MITSTLTITPAQAAAIASLAEFGLKPTSADAKVSPILATIRIEVEHGTNLTAYATDRYRVARYRDTLADAVTWDDDSDDTSASLTLDSAILTRVGKAITGDRSLTRTPDARVIIAATREPGRHAHSVTITMPDGSTILAAETDGNFPPVGRLFPDEVTAHDLPTAVSIRPDLFGSLAKLRSVTDFGVPPARYAQEGWRMRSAKPDTERGPIYCTPGDRARLDIDALIQPSLILR